MRTSVGVILPGTAEAALIIFLFDSSISTVSLPRKSKIDRESRLPRFHLCCCDLIGTMGVSTKETFLQFSAADSTFRPPHRT